MATYLLHELGCWSDVAYGMSFGNILGIENQTGFEIDIRNIIVTPTMGYDSTTNMKPQQLYRITASAAGQTVTALKNDTGSASLPAQVTAYAHGSVTTSGVLRQFGVLFGQRVTQGATPVAFVSRSPGMLAQTQCFLKTADQRVVLREGEGFAWVQDAAPIRRTQEGIFTVRNASSGATYTFRVPNTPAAEQDIMFALFNGAGSGVVLELVAAEICDIGMQGYSDGAPWQNELGNPVPGWRVVRCRSILHGDVCTPIKYDTASDDVPSGVICSRGGCVVLDHAAPMRAEAYSSIYLSSPYAGQKLLDQQHLGLIRGGPLDTLEQWSVSSTDFPFRMEGATRELVTTRTPLTHKGLVVHTDEAIALVHWYASKDSDGSAYGSPTYTEAPNTGAKYNVQIEFNVNVGEGVTTNYAPTNVGLYIS
ncbi:hypothetical protein Rctr197k_088 [Virus Rctr197k]|nr:hypothetical protein Rctr197k_088 [Virus Rctr197k]